MMEPSSFTIEFAEHTTEETRQYVLNRLAERGAEIVALGGGRFQIVCHRQREIAIIGWSLFQTHFTQLCHVTATSGFAEARADAYLKPPERD